MTIEQAQILLLRAFIATDELPEDITRLLGMIVDVAESGNNQSGKE